jgi:hypothetical protein
MAREQHVEHYHRRKLREVAREAGFANSTICTICIFSPWLAPASWKFAIAVAKRELRIPLPLGCILVAVLTKAA